jgi:predicted permease
MSGRRDPTDRARPPLPRSRSQGRRPSEIDDEVAGARPPFGFRLLLRLFPRRFRSPHGRDLYELYRDFARQGRPAGAGAAWDLLRSGLGARLDDWRSPPGGPPSSLPHQRNVHMDSIGHDIRYAARTLRRSPGFTAVAVASLAIGIGANTAVFSLIDAAMLRPLPVESPADLVVLGWRSPAGSELPDVRISGWYHRDDNGDGLSSSYSPPAFRALRAGNGSLSTLWAFAELDRLNVSVDGAAELASGQAVSGNYYGALGVVAAAGRLIGEDDDRADADPVVVLGHGYWQRRFGGGDVVGRTIGINGNPFTVIGVAAEDFTGTGQVGSDPDVTVSLAMHERVSTRAASPSDAGNWWLHLMGRLRPRVGLETAQADLELVFHRSVEADLFPDGVPEGITVPEVDLQPGAQGMNDRRRTLRQPLATTSVVVALLLVIACVNVANLLLARSGARRREIAVRLSIGASRWRLVRQLLAESVVLSLLAGGAGVLLATWGRSLLLGTLVPRDLWVGGVETNARVLGFGVLVSLLTGVVFGLVPAWRSSRPDLTPSLKQATGDAGTRAGRWLPKTLMVAQVAMSLPLLVAAGLFVRTLANLENEATGFDPEGVAILTIDARLNGYDGSRQVAMYGEVRRGLAAIPGVAAATITAHSPLSNRFSSTTLKVPGYTPAAGESPSAQYNLVGPGFFETFGIPLLLGREIGAEDRVGGRMVAVIDETLAERYFPGESPLGKRLGLGRDGAPDEYEVVGVAANVKYQRPHDPWYPVAHVSFAQHAGTLGAMTLALRTSGDPSDAMVAARNVVREVDPNVPVRDVRTLTAQVGETVERERLFVRLSAFIGALALGLACIGLYGVLSASVMRRTREIGVRMALGARAFDIVRLVAAEMRSVALGAALGILATYGLIGLLEGLLYGLSPTEPLTIAVATLLVLAVAALAAYLPARRAAAVDPLVALRAD